MMKSKAAGEMANTSDKLVQPFCAIEGTPASACVAPDRQGEKLAEGDSNRQPAGSSPVEGK